MNDTNYKSKVKATMEISKLSASLLLGIILTFGTFCFTTGVFRNEVKNIKEQMTVNKTDLEADILRVEESKADKEIVKLVLLRMDSMDEKLDKLILSNLGDK